MADQKVGGEVKPSEEVPVGAAAEKAFENEGGAPLAHSPETPVPESLMDRIEHAAGRVKARLTTRSG